MKRKKVGQDRKRAASMPGRKHRGIYLTDDVYDQANKQAGALTFSHYVEQLIIRDGERREEKNERDKFFGLDESE